MRRCHREIKSFSSPPRLKALNLPHSLGCRFRSRCFPGWSRGVYREARLSRVWLGSVGGLWGLLWHLWRRIRTCDFSLSKFRQKLGKTWNPRCLSPKPLKYHWHVFSSKAEIKRTEEGQRRELKQKKGILAVWQIFVVSVCSVVCMKLDQLSRKTRRVKGGYIVQLAIFVIFPSSANGIKDEG